MESSSKDARSKSIQWSFKMGISENQNHFSFWYHSHNPYALKHACKYLVNTISTFPKREIGAEKNLTFLFNDDNNSTRDRRGFTFGQGKVSGEMKLNSCKLLEDGYCNDDIDTIVTEDTHESRVGSGMIWAWVLRVSSLVPCVPHVWVIPAEVFGTWMIASRHAVEMTKGMEHL